MPHFITVERDELTRIEFIFATYLTEIEPCSNRPYEVYRARAAAMLEGHAFPLRVEEGSSMYNQIVEMRGLEAALRNRYYHGRVGENRNANEIEEQPNAHGPASLSDGEHYGSNFNDAEAAGRSHVSTPDTVNEVTSAGTASQLTGDTHSSQQVASYTNASTPDPNVLKITHTTTFEVGDQKVTMEFDAGVGPDRELIREIQKIWAMAVRFEITDNVSLQKLVKLAQVSVGRSP